MLSSFYKRIRHSYNNFKFIYKQKHTKNNTGYEKIVLNGVQYMDIGQNCRIGRMSKLDCIGWYADQWLSPKLTIGDNVYIGDFAAILCADSISIGDNTLIADNLLITDENHGTENNGVPYHAQPLHTKPVSIGKNVWIGANVVVLPGITVGDNAIIGAGAIVTRDIPPNAIAVGNPAKIVKYVD